MPLPQPSSEMDQCDCPQPSVPACIPPWGPWHQTSFPLYHEKTLTSRSNRITPLKGPRGFLTYQPRHRRKEQAPEASLGNCLLRTAPHQHPVDRSERRNGNPEQRSLALSMLLESKTTFQLMGPGPEGPGSYSGMCLSTEFLSCIQGCFLQPAVCPGQIQHSAG